MEEQGEAQGELEREAEAQHGQVVISPGPQHDLSSLATEAAPRKECHTESILLIRCSTNSSRGSDCNS